MCTTLVRPGIGTSRPQTPSLVLSSSCLFSSSIRPPRPQHMCNRKRPIKIIIYTPWLKRKIHDIFNFLLCFGVIVPAALVFARQLNTCASVVDSKLPTNLNSGTPSDYHLAYRWLYTLVYRPDTFFTQPSLMERAGCEVFLYHKELAVHLYYFVFVDVLFYFIYVLQGSTWLIDPHWQLLPMCMSVFYFLHPDATHNLEHHPRALLTFGLVVVWAVRLLHNYFRREEWHFGAREDWRYANMRKQHGVFFIFTQFFVVSLAQHGMLVGLTLPLSQAMLSGGSPLNWIDGVALLLCVSGIAIGFIADNQLHAYMSTPNKPLLFETGLWKYSRHPNHFGEQTWWMGLLLFGVAASAKSNGGLLSLATWWPIAFGVLFNHPLDTFVTLPLIEHRMLRRPERVKVYKEYQARTSLLFPLPPKRKRKIR